MKLALKEFQVQVTAEVCSRLKVEACKNKWTLRPPHMTLPAAHTYAPNQTREPLKAHRRPLFFDGVARVVVLSPVERCVFRPGIPSLSARQQHSPRPS